MFGICIYRAYADGEYMRMPYLCRCQAYGYALHILSFHFSRSDPKKGSSGSSQPRLALSGAETQHVPRSQLRFLPYVVFYPLTVTARSLPEKGGVVIP